MVTEWILSARADAYFATVPERLIRDAPRCFALSVSTTRGRAEFGAVVMRPRQNPLCVKRVFRRAYGRV
jgi:hypothetical protein